MVSYPDEGLAGSDLGGSHPLSNTCTGYVGWPCGSIGLILGAFLALVVAVAGNDGEPPLAGKRKQA